MRKRVLWCALTLLGVVLAIGTAFVLRVTSPTPALSDRPTPTLATSPAATAAPPKVAASLKPELPVAPFPG